MHPEKTRKSDPGAQNEANVGPKGLPKGLGAQPPPGGSWGALGGSAPGAPSVPPGASKSRQERPGSASGGTRSAPRPHLGQERLECLRDRLGRPGGRPGLPGGAKNTKIISKHTKTL